MHFTNKHTYDEVHRSFGASTEASSEANTRRWCVQILGLDMCADIIVDNELIRGISGGQKKRLTTGEVLVGPTKVLFMDEISMGLDSSTTFQIVKCIQQIVHLGEATVLASPLQPAPEVFGLFDNVMLLSEGQIVYQGPRSTCLSSSRGVASGARRGKVSLISFRRKEILDRPCEIAPLGLSGKFNDFFSFCHLALWHIQVTSKKDQEQYWIQNEKPYHYVSVPEFVAKFKKFHMGKSLKKQLSVPFHKRKIHKYALVFSKNIDPHLCLMDDCQLVNTSAESSNSEMVYGSEEDENDALAFLSAISEHAMELIETVMCHFREKFENLQEKFNGVEEQLLQEFSLDDLFPLVAPLFMETPHSCSMYAEKAEQCFDEVATDPSQIVDLCYNRYMALVDLQEGNERLFYKLLIDNIEEPLVRPAKSSYGGFIWLCRGKILEVLKTG
ncbi:hypothetical protein ZEAMMB73_Zm00001d039633 [Zea mays]|uniref:Uncharacterized protein n=1 Tax=Zea mays TaxID=4577 RepID=A0A1D6MJX0_MAIZE|nr:hypothetical protein ZEAMMB73_Zm00001d039633 [Zea mays]